MPQKPTRTALYARVSTKDRQDPRNQLQALEAYAQGAGMQIVATYVDRESGAAVHRPQFDLMLQDAANRRFDLLLFWSLDRLSRGGVKNTLDILQKLQHYGVKFRSLQQPEMDTTGPWADVIIAIFAALAQMERELLRERTKAGLERARTQGKRLGRPKAIANLSAMLELRMAGKSYEQIAAQLKVSAATVHRRIQASIHQSAAAPTRPAAKSSI